MEAPTVVVDCRWLGIAGAGRTTELVLRGLAEEPPGGRWILWGREAAIAPLAWPGTEVRGIEADPRLLLGQRHAFAVPHGEFYLFLHQQRPLRALAAATFVYDTIPLHHGGSPPVRALKRRFLRRVARTSRQILTISEHSRACILDELGVPPEKVEIVRFPYDAPLVERVARLRAGEEPIEAALFVGAFLPHKNLDRLIPAFAATRYRRAGGRLVLAGGTAAQVEALLGAFDGVQPPFVDIFASCTPADIERLYATARFLVQPSLEEGFGLPAWEAMCCGLPICVSDGGALPEVTKGFAEPFPARSEPAMTAAIDACADAAAGWGEQARAAQSALLRDRAPTVAAFGRQVRAAVGRHLPVPG